MVDWLEQNHLWILILALAWVMFGLYQIIKNKGNKTKKKSYGSDTSATIDLIGNGSTSTNQSHYGGGSGGGVGSTRSFLPTSSMHRTEANELGKVAGVVANDSAIVGSSSAELVSTAVQASAVNASDDFLGTDAITDIAESAIEVVGDVVEATVDVAGEVVSELLKS